MITKDQLQELKQEKLPELYDLLKGNKDNREVLFILENLGHLPKGFDGNVLIPFIHSANDDIRFWAVKNIGKISNPKVIDILAKITSNDKDTMVNQLDAVGIVYNKLKMNTSENM